MIDLARWYVGDIARVSGHLTSFVEREGPAGGPFTSANGSALIALEFAGGAQGTICVCGVTHVAERGQDFQVRLYGDSGVFGDRLRLRRVAAARGGEEWRDLPIPPEFFGDRVTILPLGVRLLRSLHQPVGR
jgi:predicted dehydrogenase